MIILVTNTPPKDAVMKMHAEELRILEKRLGASGQTWHVLLETGASNPFQFLPQTEIGLPTATIFHIDGSFFGGTDILDL